MIKAKILLVDDEKLILKAFKRLLEQEGYYVKTALSGNEAIDLGKIENFDIVFTDLVMPDMNGVDVCKEIKKLLPNAEVVLISGHPTQLLEHKSAFIKAGGSKEFLKKPLVGIQLIKKVEEILQARKLTG